MVFCGVSLFMLNASLFKEMVAQGWCTGMTLMDGMGGRWEGGSGQGTHVHPGLIHVNLWQKPPQYCKIIGLQLK